MAKKTKSNKVSVKSSKPQSVKQEGFLSQIKWGESYTSLFLGAVVVIVIFILLFSFLKSRNVNNQQTESTSTIQEETYENGLPKTYTVKEGDDLWTVSEKIYGSGYNWVDISDANKLENPEVLFVGSKLDVPNVEKKEIVTQEQTDKTNPITGISYNVKEGDSLWDIAVRSYGDGYKWVEIARVNKLINPNVIHPGNVIQLPR